MNHIQLDIPTLPGKQARFQPLLNKMLGKTPKERFTSMDLLSEALDIITSAAITSAAPAAVNRRASDQLLQPSTPATARPTTIHVTNTKEKLNTPGEPAVDEFLAEAYKLLAADNIDEIELPELPYRDLPTQSQASKKTPATKNNYTGNIGGPRTRPLPSNLFDDD
jgi:hypothetical protein